MNYGRIDSLLKSSEQKRTLVTLLFKILDEKKHVERIKNFFQYEIENGDFPFFFTVNF